MQDGLNQTTVIFKSIQHVCDMKYSGHSHSRAYDLEAKGWEGFSDLKFMFQYLQQSRLVTYHAFYTMENSGACLCSRIVGII